MTFIICNLFEMPGANRHAANSARHSGIIKWLRYFLDFRHKYTPPEAKSELVRLFIEKLRRKKIPFLQSNYDIRTIQTLLGDADLRTTMIYTHCVPSMTVKEAKSPLDF